MKYYHTVVELLKTYRISVERKNILTFTAGFLALEIISTIPISILLKTSYITTLLYLTVSTLLIFSYFFITFYLNTVLFSGKCRFFHYFLRIIPLLVIFALLHTILVNSEHSRMLAIFLVFELITFSILSSLLLLSILRTDVKQR